MSACGGMSFLCNAPKPVAPGYSEDDWNFYSGFSGDGRYRNSRYEATKCVVLSDYGEYLTFPNGDISKPAKRISFVVDMMTGSDVDSEQTILQFDPAVFEEVLRKVKVQYPEFALKLYGKKLYLTSKHFSSSVNSQTAAEYEFRVSSSLLESNLKNGIAPK